MKTKTQIALYAQQIAKQVETAMAGKEQTVMWILAAILAGGHILLEDIPGVGKTSLALALSQVLGLDFGRVQFTPDVMVSDVVGYCVPDLKSGEMLYKEGAVMCNLFLADELNRAPSRTQAALLEAMEEGQVTVDGVCHKLPAPFVVIATQNPTGAAGTQPLPDSQLDRFCLRLRLGYPGTEAEKNMILRSGGNVPRQITTARELLQMQQTVAQTYISETVAAYGVHLMAATRKDLKILRGASPRATLSVMALAKALAQLQGRDFVVPEDVQRAFLQGIPHRIAGETRRLQKIVKRVRAPRMCQ